MSIPLVGKCGQSAGNFCIMDTVKRKLTEEQLSILKILVKRIVNQIAINKNLVKQEDIHRLAYQRLYAITSQSPDYIFTLDLNLNVTYINHLKFQSSENVLHKNALTFIEPEFENEFVTACRTSLDDLKVIEKDFSVSKSFGKRCYSVKFCPLKNNEGIADSLLLIASDVTSEREIREELIKQQKILSEAQNISQTGSCEWDVQSGEAKFSDGLYNILGIEKSVHLTHIKSLSERVHPDDRQRAEDLTTRAIKTLSTLVFKYKILTPDGELKYIDGRGGPLVIKGKKVISVLVTLQDITASVNFDKKLFTAVVQSEEKERARMAGELHDGVCQYLAGSKLMLTDLEAITGMLQYSKKTLSDALDLTQQISHNLLPGEFHKKGVIQTVIEMTEFLNSADKIHYTINVNGNDTGLDPVISINIFRIVQEFIRNSQKYSEASAVNISIDISDKEVLLEIKDNGKGFDLNSVKKKSGVGLLSMRKRIQSIGGSFTYETSPGKGVYLALKMGLEMKIVCEN